MCETYLWIAFSYYFKHIPYLSSTFKGNSTDERILSKTTTGLRQALAPYVQPNCALTKNNWANFQMYHFSCKTDVI